MAPKLMAYLILKDMPARGSLDVEGYTKLGLDGPNCGVPFLCMPKLVFGLGSDMSASEETTTSDVKGDGRGARSNS